MDSFDITNLSSYIDSLQINQTWLISHLPSDWIPWELDITESRLVYQSIGQSLWRHRWCKYDVIVDIGITSFPVIAQLEIMQQSAS